MARSTFFSCATTRTIAYRCILFVVILHIPPCYEKTTLADQEIFIYPDSVYSYKLQVRQMTWMLPGCSCTPYQHVRSDWIYISSRTGTLDTSQFAFTDLYDQRQYPDRRTVIRGTLILSTDSVEISLSFPCYTNGNTVDHWTPYEFNGHYKLTPRDTVSESDKNRV